jgi:hypothetical protein
MKRKISNEKYQTAKIRTLYWNYNNLNFNWYNKVKKNFVNKLSQVKLKKKHYAKVLLCSEKLCKIASYYFKNWKNVLIVSRVV